MKKIGKFIKDCPLLLLIVISAIGLWAWEEYGGGFGEMSAMASVEVPDESVVESLEELDLEDITEDAEESLDPVTDTEAVSGGSIQVADGTQVAMTTDGAIVSGDGIVVTEGPIKIKPEYIPHEKIVVDSKYYSDPGKTAQTTKYDYDIVKNTYFDDAIFIGDSRIVGLGDYSGLTNATFCGQTGMNIYSMWENPCVEDPKTGEKVSVSHVLQNNKYGKIYLMVGINELGTGNTKYFQAAYKKVLKEIQKLQPDAIIYVQSIMAVAEEKSEKDPIFNNVNINDKNVAISKLTNGIDIFYLNVNSVYVNEKGALNAEDTFDQVHLYANQYKKWLSFLKHHAVGAAPEEIKE